MKQTEKMTIGDRIRIQWDSEILEREKNRIPLNSKNYKFLFGGWNDYLQKY